MVSVNLKYARHIWIILALHQNCHDCHKVMAVSRTRGLFLQNPMLLAFEPAPPGGLKNGLPNFVVLAATGEIALKFTSSSEYKD